MLVLQIVERCVEALGGKGRGTASRMAIKDAHVGGGGGEGRQQGVGVFVVGTWACGVTWARQFVHRVGTDLGRWRRPCGAEQDGVIG